MDQRTGSRRGRLTLLILATIGALVAVLLGMSIVADGGGKRSDSSLQIVASPTVAALSPCWDDRMAIDELESAQAAWDAQRTAMIDQAHGWSAQAELIQLTLSCQIVSAEEAQSAGEFGWNGVFYDEAGIAEQYWHSATGKHFYVIEDAAIDAEAISFAQLSEWLQTGGYDRATTVVSVTVTKKPDPMRVSDEHISYVVTIVDETLSSIVVVADSRDGSITEQAG